jgi:hypothetical protein
MMVAMSNEVEERVVQNATPLTVPCSLNALRNWLKSTDALTPGKESGVTVSATASSLTVA